MLGDVCAWPSDGGIMVVEVVPLTYRMLDGNIRRNCMSYQSAFHHIWHSSM
jgi:hypothetical protein